MPSISTAPAPAIPSIAHPAEVLHYRIQNGGHNWPGDSTAWPAWAAPVNQDLSASAEIWNFFSQHEVRPFLSRVVSGLAL